MVTNETKISIPEQKKVMFKFDDEDPQCLGFINKGESFILKVKEKGFIEFRNNDKVFKIYIE